MSYRMKVLVIGTWTLERGDNIAAIQGVGLETIEYDDPTEEPEQVAKRIAQFGFFNFDEGSLIPPWRIYRIEWEALDEKTGDSSR